MAVDHLQASSLTYLHNATSL